MGGINHQPTSNASHKFTVPASEALSNAFAHFMLGNAAIEKAITAEPGCDYAVARQHQDGAVLAFKQAQPQLVIFTHFVAEILHLLQRGDYEPFRAANTLSDPNGFVVALQEVGLLPRSESTDRTAKLLIEGGYVALFQSYLADAEMLGNQLEVLIGNTIATRDGVAGHQGLFWQTVESNSQPWRQAFALVLSRFTSLVTSFQTGALISTETYLRGMGQPGLLTNIDEVTLKTRNVAPAAAV